MGMFSEEEEEVVFNISGVDILHKIAIEIFVFSRYIVNES